MPGATTGVVFGLTSAMLWGLGDFSARLASEKSGSQTASFFVQLFSLIILVAMFFAIPSMGPVTLDSTSITIGLTVGALNATAVLLLYRALELGPVSLVSPISSSYAAISATLAIITGERPTLFQIIGITLTLLGVIAASTTNHSEHSSNKRGVPIAIACALLWGLTFYLLRPAVQSLGPILPILTTRVSALLILGLGVTLKKVSIGKGTISWRWIILTTFSDTGAFLAYNFGARTSITSVISVLSSLFSAVTVLLAFFVLRERLRRIQWLAIFVIMLGIGLVSYG